MSNHGPLLSRRRVLALCGVSGAVGAGSGYLVGSDALTNWRSSCEPGNRLTHPDDWPAPRYNAAGTGASPTRNVPVGNLHEAWHTDFRAQRIGQPVLSTGRVAVATFSRRWDQLVAFDFETGEEVWRERISDGGDIGSLLAGGGDLFYRTGLDEGGQGVIGVSLQDGERYWTGFSERNPQSGPVVTEDGYVWLTQRHPDEEESSVVALSADTGDECSAWRVDGSGGGTVVVDDDFLFHGTRAGAVALDWTGEEHWRSEDPWYPHAVRNGTVHATRDSNLCALDADTGDVLWTAETEHYVDGESHPGNPDMRRAEDGEWVTRPRYETFAITDDVLVVRERVYSDHPDHIVAFDAETGTEGWTLAPDGNWPDPDRHTWYTGPSVAGDSVFVCENWRDHESSLQRVDIATGEILDSVALVDFALDAPSISRGGVVVPCRSGVTCYAGERWV